MSTNRNLWMRTLLAAALTAPLVFTLAGCNGCNSSQSAPITNGAANGQDPAMANLADPSYNAPATAVLGQEASYNGQANGESYGPGQQAPAPIVNGNGGYSQQSAYDSGYDQGANDEASVYATQAPPPLPEYDQPPAPDDNYLWTPGYWNYANANYYWVPGAWVAAPYYGALWTPPYWGYYGNRYYFHHGYWGPHVGFYGGINYGYGYIGTGYWGGYWRGHDFWYNRAVTRVGPRFGNVYERNVVYNNQRYGMQPNNRISYNGGPRGIQRAPQGFERAAMNERHVGPVAGQVQLRDAAMRNRGQFASPNGRPAQFAETRGIGNAHEIRATPAGVTVGRPGMNGNNRAGGNAPNGAVNGGGARGFAGAAGAAPNNAAHGGQPNAPGNNVARGGFGNNAGNHAGGLNGAPNHAAPAAGGVTAHNNAGGFGNHGAATPAAGGVVAHGAENRGGEAARGGFGNRGGFGDRGGFGNRGGATTPAAGGVVAHGNENRGGFGGGGGARTSAPAAQPSAPRGGFGGGAQPSAPRGGFGGGAQPAASRGGFGAGGGHQGAPAAQPSGNHGGFGGGGFGGGHASAPAAAPQVHSAPAAPQVHSAPAGGGGGGHMGGGAPHGGGGGGGGGPHGGHH